MTMARSLFSLAVLLTVFLQSTLSSPSGSTALAPLYIPSVAAHDRFNNSYIVMLEDDISPATFSAHFSFLSYVDDANPLEQDGSPFSPKYVYDSDIVKGYAGSFSEQVLDMIRQRPEVKYVEQDQAVYPHSIQCSPPWGLARINHRPQIYMNNMHYMYADKAGEGVMAYVIDTGVYIGHEEFEGRAYWGKSFYPDEEDVDFRGHGTHVAGTIASRLYGVAKKAEITSVKVFPAEGSGDSSTTIAAIEWAIEDARRLAQERNYKGFVLNLSLGGGYSQAQIDTVNNAVTKGYYIVVSAGNDNEDACTVAPAAAELAITIGASTVYDERADFSNHGKCVDVFAPGRGVLSTGLGRQNATAVMSGTSMAAPHVAGLVAYLLSIYPHSIFSPRLTEDLEEDSILSSIYSMAHDVLPGFFSHILPVPVPSRSVGPSAKKLTPIKLKKALLNLASPGLLSDIPADTPNLLIFNNMSHGIDP